LWSKILNSLELSEGNFCVLGSESNNSFFFFSNNTNNNKINDDDADISPLLAKADDPKMAEDPGVLEVVKQLDKACTEAGFFYVVIVCCIY